MQPGTFLPTRSPASPQPGPLETQPTWPYLLLMPYLLKTEPGKYSYDDLLRDGETVWDGISNNQALLTLRNMKKGDKLVIYHSNVGKAAVGTAKVVSVDASDAKNPAIRIQPLKRLKKEKPLAEIRESSVFQGSPLFRQFRLSVVPLTEEQYLWLTDS